MSMSMKQKAAILREMRTAKGGNIANSHNVCSAFGGKVFISYVPEETGRSYRAAGWNVCGIGFKTDPDGWWGNHGAKTFDVHAFRTYEMTHHEAKAAAFEAAKAWCVEKYGLTEWVKDPFGGYQTPDVIERMEKAIKEVKK